VLAALLPFFISYEKSAPSARELSLMAGADCACGGFPRGVLFRACF
jgi:hypothetical protein